jgi:ribosomal protein L18E
MPEELCLDPSDITAADPIDCIRADNLITDALAKDLLRRSREVIFTSGTRREIINVDTLSDSFSAHDRVDVNILKDKSLIHPDTSYVKVLARGTIDKPLKVYANDFSLSAVKMIALTGGEGIRVSTLGDDIHEPFDDSSET